MHTAFTQLTGVEHPVVQSGMSESAGAALAAAVSGAGGLGTIGSMGRTPDGLVAEIRALRERTTRPFSVNLATFDWGPDSPRLIEATIEERVPIVTLSFGDPIPALRACKDAGLQTIVQVQDTAGARAALAAGADALVAQGSEAGGHTGRRGTLSFAAQVLDLAGDVPVLVAGGVAGGRGLAAALAMGASGVLMGTRFKATPEFLGSDEHKAQIVASDGGNTLQDLIVDLVYGGPWPNGVIGRVLANDFTAEWLGRDDELVQAVDEVGVEAFVTAMAGDPRRALNWAGESSGLIDAVMPAGEVVRQTVAGAEALLRRAMGVFSG